MVLYYTVTINRKISYFVISDSLSDRASLYDSRVAIRDKLLKGNVVKITLKFI